MIIEFEYCNQCAAFSRQKGYTNPRYIHWNCLQRLHSKRDKLDIVEPSIEEPMIPIPAADCYWRKAGLIKESR